MPVHTIMLAGASNWETLISQFSEIRKPQRIRRREGPEPQLGSWLTGVRRVSTTPLGSTP